MKRIVRLRLALLAFMLVGCQAIADLTVPTYESSTGSGGGATTSSGSSVSSSSSGAGGTGACAPTPSGDGGGCTFDRNNATVPCPEHLRLWLDADDACSLETDDKGNVHVWKDRSSFGWTATNTSTSMKVIESDGRRTVHIEPPGMTLTPPAGDGGVPPSFAPAGLLVAGALRWDKLGTGDYGESDALCLGSTRYADRLQFGTQAQGGQQPKMLLRVTNDSSRYLTMDRGGGVDAGTWMVLLGGYACGSDCPGASAPAATLAVNANIGPPEESGGAPPSLVPRKQGDGWNGYWNASLLGLSCDGRDTMTGEIGELLVYDTYLDEKQTERVYAYLSQRWP